MSERKEQEPTQKLTREQMLAHIKASDVRVWDIYGHGPGTGFNPDISQLPDESLEAVYNAVRFVEEEQQKEQGNLPEPDRS